MRSRQGDRPGRRIVRTLALAFAALTLLGACSAATAAAVPAKFWGVDPQTLPTDEEFQRLQRGGVDTLRFPIEWNGVESVEGKPDWSYIDAVVKETAMSGIEPLPFITGAPEWVIRSVSVNAAAHSFAPRQLPVKTGAMRGAWQRFLTEVVERYGPNGAFWGEHPGVPYIPIRTWQIWNEPNFKYFVAAPNPADYGKLVKLSYTAIKAVDPGAQLLLAGLYARPKEAGYRYRKIHPRPALYATEFLEKMYRKTPGIKKKFQGVALHPYSVHFRELAPVIQDVRRVLRKAGDGRKGLWITELGWSSKKAVPNNQFAKGVKGQARELKGAFKLLERNISKWRLRRVFWFSVDDHPGNCNFCDGSGLFEEGFIPKPSWKAYVRFAGGTP